MLRCGILNRPDMPQGKDVCLKKYGLVQRFVQIDTTIGLVAHIIAETTADNMATRGAAISPVGSVALAAFRFGDPKWRPVQLYN